MFKDITCIKPLKVAIIADLDCNNSPAIEKEYSKMILILNAKELLNQLNLS
jgi:hypothetical protein